jgi:hypothetical protein
MTLLTAAIELGAVLVVVVCGATLEAGEDRTRHPGRTLTAPQIYGAMLAIGGALLYTAPAGRTAALLTLAALAIATRSAITPISNAQST